MYVSGLGPTLRRHWRLAVVGGVVTLALCAGALRVIPPTYQAEASVLILPSTTSVGEGGNPYLALGGLQPTADAVARAMGDEQVVQGLQASGATGDYAVETDRTTGGPVLAVTVKDSERAAALQSLRLVVGRIPTILAELQRQAAVPNRARLVSQVLAQDRAATPVLKSRIRGLAVAAALGLGLTVGGIVLIDNYARMRRRSAHRRSGGRPDAAEPARSANGNGNGNGHHVALDELVPIDEETMRIRRPTAFPAPADEEATRIRTYP